jgi:hypothetical protein
MKKQHALLLLAGLALFLGACTASPVELSESVTGEAAGFWLGLWQGFIAPFTFIVSLFNDSVAIYAVHNTGGWYDFGFLLGASMFFGGSGRGSTRRWRRRRETS